MIGGFVVPLAKLNGPRQLFGRVIPPLYLIVLTGAFIVGEISSGIREYTDWLEGWVRFRAGEMQENFIIPFLFFYILCLWRRARRIESGEWPGDGEDYPRQHGHDT